MMRCSKDQLNMTLPRYCKEFTVPPYNMKLFSLFCKTLGGVEESSLLVKVGYQACFSRAMMLAT